MCRALHSGNGEVGPCGQLCWWPAQKPSLSLAPNGIPVLFRCQLLRGAMSLGEAHLTPASGMAVASHWPWLVHPSVCDLVFCQGEGSSAGKAFIKKLIPSIESHWKDAVSLVPIDVMSRCNDRYSHSSVAICLRMKDMPRVVSRP